MAKVAFEAAMQHCCDTINAAGFSGPRSQARFTMGGISVEFEVPRSNVSVHIDPVFEDRKLRGRVQVSSNATQLSTAAAQEFVVLYQQVLTLAQTLQSYLDSTELVVE